ncbi:MAG: AbrB/MazE/SpoVT family DNA-binding domain-containing protein [Candidatus Brocadiaceae bacterium]|nr:AbrB/MazE/SpoVT family DNA-binding domain-containing protein [Candidatus Brocadiaceae bacterium]
MPVATVSSKGQLVIPKEIRDTLGIKSKQKVLLKVVKGHAIIEPLPEKPVETFCGIFKEGASLTKALLKQRRVDKKHEEKNTVGLIRPSRVSKKRK